MKINRARAREERSNGAPDRSRLSWQLRLKGALDRALAVTALLVVWPLLLVLAGVVRLSSPGPALYGQTRLWAARPIDRGAEVPHPLA